MRTIALDAIPNQNLTARLEGARYELTIKEAAGVMCVDVIRDNVIILSGQRIVAGTPLIPYTYLERGNFLILTQNEEIPYYTAFGITQTLVYLTLAEIEAIRGAN